ncbi:uncharacterized protein LOC123447913 [Hordeum vulgare subsp. vulgare]|uniref:Uncharacterized protein n=1 Tax=Hordeum vulgare subsp. vulgare TaxID=112509 RepID=M0WT00_HORVV|nr:uncharacterized protein LOC123447913 [Hordeum vulgare subsp. vulgare]XP_044980570.1 uncharacterized protein LOC123447913 [Hordeum vulgare subsp. vulgare]
MECNREEALRAREIAVKMLENKDFLGARRIALKAQRLFPGFENIHQLLTVCEVHCAAVAKINGDLDWYRILQVEATADETVITKQYDKLAFWLHPDKNTLSGAEVALKLVSEARKILSDRTERSLYDIRRQYASKHVTSKASHVPNKTGGNISHVNGCKQPPALVVVFWTICPHCRRRFVYYKKNFLVICDNCGKLFFAFKLHEQTTPSSFLSYSANNAEVSPGKISCQQHGVTNQQAQTGGNIDSEPTMNVARIDEHTERDDRASGDEEGNRSETRSDVVQFSAMNQAKSSVPAADKVSVSNLRSTHPDPNLISTQNEDASLVPNIARSSSLQRLGKRKQDDGTDCSHGTGSSNYKRQRNHDLPSSASEQMSNDNAAVAENQSAEHHALSRVDSQDGVIASHEANQQSYKEASGSAPQKPGSPVIAYNHPDFFDFGKIRDVNLIAVDQIWALYDNLDGMPRVYAQVKRIDTSDFRVQLTWLEYNPRNEQEANWNNKELPVSCGSFCLGGETNLLQDPSIYLSHRVPLTKGKNGNSYEINPNKGEVWALYKRWSMQWISDADNCRSYGYDLVEVISDGSTSGDVIVSPLMRIEGFVSLFAQAKDKCFFLIPSSELLRFSHCIPFYRTNGNERVGVAEGFLELDTAALPSDLERAFPSSTLGSYMSSEFISYPYPESEFHNFEEDRSCEKFENGQIWAIYNDADTFPNVYGWVRKVETQPFEVHLTWLQACPQQAQEKLWLGQNVPVSCGKFEIRSWEDKYGGNHSFSDLVENSQINMNWQVKIHPKVDEVWAIHKNWSPDWVPSSNKHTTHYAIGEIVECSKRSTLLSFLTKVDGYVAVFKPDPIKEVLKIPRKENLRFSHRIPSFRLTEEKGGKLRDFYELDPASVPGDFL